MTDIDLLVRKEKLTEVETKLVAMGYGFEDPGKTKEFYQQHHYHWEFRGDPPLTSRFTGSLDVRQSFRIDIDGLWERAQPTKSLVLRPLYFRPRICCFICANMSGNIA